MKILEVLNQRSASSRCLGFSHPLQPVCSSLTLRQAGGDRVLPRLSQGRLAASRGDPAQSRLPRRQSWAIFFKDVPLPNSSASFSATTCLHLYSEWHHSTNTDQLLVVLAPATRQRTRQNPMKQRNWEGVRAPLGARGKPSPRCSSR